MGVVLTDEMIKVSQENEKKFGIPTSITLGQIILESGGSNKGGLSDLAYNYNNLFGVTSGSSWDGKTVTLSNKNGTDTQNYRVYESIADSITDHSKVLLNDRYTKYTNDATTIEEYAKGIQQGEYATDPQYSTKLINVINSNNLSKYDLGYTSNGVLQHLENQRESNDLKWWGDIVVFVLTVLAVGCGVLFFLLAFGGIDNINPVNKVKKLIK